MPHGVHAKDQTAFRLDPDLRARLKARAEKDGQSMTDIAARGITAELDRLDGITTSAVQADPVSPPRARKPRAVPAVSFVAAEDEQPKQAGKNCTHRNMRMTKGICPDCHQPVGYK